MKRIFLLITAAIITLAAKAQMADPVHFSSELKMLSGNEAEIIFKAVIDPGWHVYSTDLGNDGPVEATFNIDKMEGAERVGKLKPIGKEIKKFDPLFGMELRYFEKTATFKQKIRFTQKHYNIDAYLEYGACNDESCMPPTQVTFRKSGNIELKDAAVENAPKELEATPAEKVQDTTTADTVAVVATTDVPGNADLWQPVINELQNMGENDGIAGKSLLYILLMGFIGGLPDNF